MIKGKKLLFFILGFIFLSLIFIGVYLLIGNYSKSKFFNGETLIGEVVIEGDSIGTADGIICLNNYLVLLDRKPLGGRGKIQVYSLDDFNLISSIGREGSGPGELRSPTALNYVPGNGFKFSVFDVSLNRLTVYSLIGGNCKVDRIVPFEGAGIYYAHVVNDSVIGALNILSDARISLYNFSGKKIGEFGELLPGRKEGVPLYIHQASMQGKLAVSPDGLRFVVSATFSDFIDVYKGREFLKRFSGPAKILPRYNIVASQMSIDTERAIWGYIDIVLTNEHIYALYSGNPFKSGAGGKFIHVYNYDGKLIKTYLLDREVFGISFDPMGKIFYAIDKSLTQIVRFKIKDATI